MHIFGEIRLLCDVFFPVFGFGIEIIDACFLINDLANFNKLFNQVVDLLLLGVDIIGVFSLGLVELTDRIVMLRVAALVRFGLIVP